MGRRRGFPPKPLLFPPLRSFLGSIKIIFKEAIRNLAKMNCDFGDGDTQQSG